MNLSSDWFTEPVFDFEYKKYQLLGYLQKKQKELSIRKIHPHIDELENHLFNLDLFLLRKNQLEDSFRKEIQGINLKKMELEYQSFTDKTGLEELNDIIEYSHQKISDCHLHFALEAEEIRKKINLELLGLLPSYLQEGFLLIRQASGIFVFNYQVKPVLNAKGEKNFDYHYLEKHSPSLFSQEDSIKREVQKKWKYQYDHPAFFQIVSESDYPIYETILPIAGKELNRWIK